MLRLPPYPASLPSLRYSVAGRGSSSSTGGCGGGAERRSTSHSRQRSASDATTSIGRMLRADMRRAAMSAARPRAWAPSAAATSGSTPWASAAPMRPLNTSPLPPVASPGLPDGDGEQRPALRGDDGRHAFQQDDRAGFLRCCFRRAPGIELALGRQLREQGAELARVRRQHGGSAFDDVGQLVHGTLKRDERIGVEHDGFGTAGQLRYQLAPPGRAAEPGADDERVGAGDQLLYRRCRRAVERPRVRLQVRLRLHQRGDGVRRRDGVHQAGARGKRGTRRHADRAGHARIPTDDHDPPARPLVVAGVEPGQPLGGVAVG